MKTAEELNALKEEVETLNKKLAELSEEELEQVMGGYMSGSIMGDIYGAGQQCIASAADFTGKIKYPGFGNLDESK